MKKLFAFLCLLTMPLSLSALLIDPARHEMLSEAKAYKTSAMYYLHQADLHASFIPDLTKRQHMHSLITSAISAGAIQDPKLKLLTVGLTIISSFATEAYDKYCDTRICLAKASAYLEQMNHYNRLYLETKNETKGYSSPHNSEFIIGFNYITLADMLATTIRENHYQGLRISNQICEVRDSIMKQLYENPLHKLTERPSIQMYYFIENFGEITADVAINNEVLLDELNNYLIKAFNKFKDVEKCWGLEDKDNEWILKDDMKYRINTKFN